MTGNYQFKKGLSSEKFERVERSDKGGCSGRQINFFTIKGTYVQ